MHRVVAIGFDHMHAGDQLRLAVANPDVAVVGAIDSRADRMARVCHDVGAGDLPMTVHPDAGSDREVESALDAWKPDLAVVCSTTAAHRAWVERLAERGVAVILEKPFGPSLDDVDAMIAAAHRTTSALAVNWPLAWVAAHRTTARLVLSGAIGDVTEVHYYGGNRGPLRHGHDKVELDADDADRDDAWWYSRAAGGGSLRDYLGYGTTLGTWFRDGAQPRSVTAASHVPDGLEVDEQSVVIAAYASGLSTFHTRWGTYTDPWTHQTQPRCGFVVIGTAGSVASPDYAATVRLQDADHPQGVDVAVDRPAEHETDSIAAMLHHLDTGAPLDGPMSAAVCRIGQVVVEAAARSAATGCTVHLDPPVQR